MKIIISTLVMLVALNASAVYNNFWTTNKDGYIVTNGAAQLGITNGSGGGGGNVNSNNSVAFIAQVTATNTANVFAGNGAGLTGLPTTNGFVTASITNQAVQALAANVVTLNAAIVTATNNTFAAATNNIYPLIPTTGTFISTNTFYAVALTNSTDFYNAFIDIRNNNMLLPSASGMSLVDAASFVASEGYTNYSMSGSFLSATNVTFSKWGAKFNYNSSIRWPAAVGPTNTVVIVWRVDQTNTAALGGYLGGLENTNTGDREYLYYNTGGFGGWLNWFMSSGTNVWPTVVYPGTLTNLLTYSSEISNYYYAWQQFPRHTTMIENNGQGQVLVWNDGVFCEWYNTGLTNLTYPIYPAAMNTISLGQPILTNGVPYGTNGFAGYIESVQVYNGAGYSSTNIQVPIWVSDWMQSAHKKTFWIGDSRFAWQGAPNGTNIQTYLDSLQIRSDYVSYPEFEGGTKTYQYGFVTNLIAMHLPHGKITQTEVQENGGINDIYGSGETAATILSYVSNAFCAPFLNVPNYQLSIWDVWPTATNSSVYPQTQFGLTNLNILNNMLWTNVTWVSHDYQCSLLVSQSLLNTNNIPRYSLDGVHFNDPTNGLAAYQSLAGLYISTFQNPSTVPGQPINIAVDGTALTNLNASALTGAESTSTYYPSNAWSANLAPLTNGMTTGAFKFANSNGWPVLLWYSNAVLQIELKP